MKFNTFFNNKRVTKNHEGAKAYTLNPKEELYTAVVSSILSQSFYETEDERLKRIKKLVKTTGKRRPRICSKTGRLCEKENVLENGTCSVDSRIGKALQWRWPGEKDCGESNW